MKIKADIIKIIQEAVPGCIAEHDRDGYDKLHTGDLDYLGEKIAAYIRENFKKK